MNELYHHGIKGMKWGVRRYENRDGTLTSLGKKRYDKELHYLRKNHGKGKIPPEQAARDPNSWVKTDRENTKQVLNESRNAATNSSSAIRKIGNYRRSKAASQMDLSNMTNKELQDAITRMNLEKQYRSLSTENIATGADYVSDVVSIAGDVLAVGASAIGIAVGINTLMNR